jgi:hypothetical protein
MRASIGIEAIGDNTYQYMRLWTGVLNDGISGLGDSLGCPKPDYWVAMIVGRDNKYGYSRQFLKPKKDYAHANSQGSRGVYLWYILDSGYVYEVSAPKNWNKTERYFCTVTDGGDICRVEKEYVDQWVKDHLV